MQLRSRHIVILAGLLGALLTLCSGCTPNGIYHTVQPGQTLYRIARTYDVDEAELTRLNHIRDPRLLKAGQRLYIPGASRPRSVVSTSQRPPVAPTRTAEKLARSTPKKELQPPPGRSASKSSSPPARKSQNARPIKGLFDWPVKGKVLNGFGANGNSTHKGIEIETRQGAPVLAAAPGKVIYSGNAIRGYGNLIILEHSDNYFTVYGYNQKNLVAMDDFVGQGDKIALSGSPPNGKSPRLHFEIRRGKAAVDPIFYLP